MYIDLYIHNVMHRISFTQSRLEIYNLPFLHGNRLFLPTELCSVILLGLMISACNMILVLSRRKTSSIHVKSVHIMMFHIYTHASCM